MGARVAGADRETRYSLEHYGKCVGLAFQIADDLLDVTGSAAKMGKKARKDSSLGKLTYPGLLGIAGSQQRARDRPEDGAENTGRTPGAGRRDRAK